MVKVKSFRGYIANSEIASEIASRPYDVITRAQAKKLTDNKQVQKTVICQHSYYHVIRPEISLHDLVEENDPQVYALGKKNLENFIKEGYLKEDTNSRIYVYQTEFKGIISTGLFLLVSIEDYKSNLVKKHELTRADKELDRTHLINAQDANAEPILITYRNINTIEELIEMEIKSIPYLSVQTDDDHAKHKIWLLSEEQSLFIETQFAQNVESLYIADGHHRMAASYNVAKQRRKQLIQQGTQLTGEEPFEYTMAFVVSSKYLKICGYHRIIKSLNGVNSLNILEKISSLFDLTQLYDNFEPQKKGDYSILIDGKWFKMTVKPEVFKKYLGQKPSTCQQLDVQLLQDLCISPIFGINDLRTDSNIEYVGGDDGIRGLESKVFQDGASVAIACFPVQIEEVFDIADNNQIMLPKSTWIVPKPRSGIVMRTFY